VLAVMTVVYALSIADRFSISTLIEPIRLELQLSDSGIAFLTGVALALFYVTIGIPIALLADRANRRNILAIALALWSAMTALCGLAQNYWQLLLARFGVGIGEAGGTPPATSILADKFPPEKRPMALTIFALGACLGAWLGSSIAGDVADHGGWRAAFLVLGIPGLIVALVVRFTVREPQRGRLDEITAKPPPTTLLATLAYVGRHKSAFHLANVANLVIAPQLIGWLSDWFAAEFGAGTESLRWALLILAPTGFWAAWHLGATRRTIIEDEAAAKGHVSPSQVLG
jgi:predicted MFS family arabinose efflux permease